MTIEERIEFLMQSIESHDRQIGELTENAAKLDARLTSRLDILAANLDRFRQTSQLNFDRLTQAMMGLPRLEGGPV